MNYFNKVLKVVKINKFWYNLKKDLILFKTMYYSTYVLYNDLRGGCHPGSRSVFYGSFSAIKCFSRKKSRLTREIFLQLKDKE